MTGFFFSVCHRAPCARQFQPRKVLAGGKGSRGRGDSAGGKGGGGWRGGSSLDLHRQVEWLAARICIEPCSRNCCGAADVTSSRNTRNTELCGCTAVDRMHTVQLCLRFTRSTVILDLDQLSKGTRSPASRRRLEADAAPLHRWNGGYKVRKGAI